MNKIILDKIRQKREFSQLPEKDIELAYEQFAKRQTTEEEKIKLTRELLRKTFSPTPKKLINMIGLELDVPSSSPRSDMMPSPGNKPHEIARK